MSGSRNLDVHLVETLDHLLRERSVTMTAHRLGVSQPAVSASLAKLRRHFDDQLLVREGGQYVLTPLAATLAERTPAALAQMQGLFHLDEFDPATTEREFSLVASDHVTTVYGPGLVTALRAEAPYAGIRFAPAGPSAGGFAGRLLEVDGLVLPRASVPDFPFVDVATDDWVLVVSRHLAPADAGLSLPELQTRPWVTFRLHGGHVPPLEYLHSQGIETRIDVVVSDFVSIPFLVAGTDRIGLLPRRLATLLAEPSQTRVVESPVPLPALIMTLLFHPAKELDPAHAWLRQLLARMAGALQPGGRS